MMSASLYAMCVALAVASPQPNPPQWPDSVTVFDPETAGNGLRTDVQKPINDVYLKNGGPAEHGQFSSHRHAFLFKPGSYDIEVPVGYYTQVLGLGTKPSEVIFTSARGVFCEEANTDASPGALDTFWRGAENFQTDATFPWFNNEKKGMLWAASQAAPLRRIVVNNDIWLFEYVPPALIAGMASGGFMGNSEVRGTVISGSQQQYLARNCEVGKGGVQWADGWSDGVWNMVFVGVEGAPEDHCGVTPPGSHPYTVIDEAPVIAEKPFVSIKADDTYELNIPRVFHNTKGHHFHHDADKIAFEHVYVAKSATDTAATIQAQLDDGLHVVFSPGIYQLEAALEVKIEGQVLLGLGLATLVATAGTPCVTVGNVDGVRVAGLLLQAGAGLSESLLEWGNYDNRYAGNPANPGVATDIFARVGGPAEPAVSQTKIMVRINSGHVVMDNCWLWRADHVEHIAGDGLVRNGDNPVTVGAVVNGDNVVTYGLKVEHALQDQVQWNGNAGKCFMFQAEMPYDVTQENFGDKGYTGYRVADSVTEHNAYGIGVYHYFRDAAVTVENGIVCPPALVNSFVHPLAVRLNGLGTFNHILNEFGPAVSVNPSAPGDANPQWICDTLPITATPSPPATLAPAPTPAPPAPTAPPVVPATPAPTASVPVPAVTPAPTPAVTPAPAATPPPAPAVQCNTKTDATCNVRTCKGRSADKSDNSHCVAGWEHGVIWTHRCRCDDGYCFVDGACTSTAGLSTLVVNFAEAAEDQVEPLPRSTLPGGSFAACVALAIAAAAGMFFHARRVADRRIVVADSLLG